MNPILKNALLVFTLMCVLIFVIFAVELVRLNAGSDNDGVYTPPTSGGATGGDISGAGTPPTGDGTGVGTGLPDDTGTPTSPSDTPSGQRYELPITESMKLVLYADEELFERSETGSGDVVFTHTGGTNTSALEIILDADVVPEGYLNAYTNGTTVVGGDRAIGNSELRGTFVMSEGDNEIFEAWIYSYPYDDLQGVNIVFVINYATENQKEDFYKVLDTLAIERE
uniref:Uncharacterized protein n=1 Tax=uncultured bacterium contig00102 TaxID=1181569 RepID=A0A806KQR0_9BACT|nr:hypothetical protein [uncultured bacterium contig00102]